MEAGEGPARATAVLSAGGRAGGRVLRRRPVYSRWAGAPRAASDPTMRAWGGRQGLRGRAVRLGAWGGEGVGRWGPPGSVNALGCLGCEACACFSRGLRPCAIGPPGVRTDARARPLALALAAARAPTGSSARVAVGYLALDVLTMSPCSPPSAAAHGSAGRGVQQHPAGRAGGGAASSILAVSHAGAWGGACRRRTVLAAKF